MIQHLSGKANSTGSEMTGFGVVVVVNRWHQRDSQDNEAVSV